MKENDQTLHTNKLPDLIKLWANIVLYILHSNQNHHKLWLKNETPDHSNALTPVPDEISENTIQMAVYNYCGNHTQRLIAYN